ncbi:hypothetical protein FQN55_009075 [Onygenales sp. PD_40]|nr:hypothetical protein FQN55_009075 [Onygenales sp. PD_40]
MEQPMTPCLAERPAINPPAALLDEEARTRYSKAIVELACGSARLIGELQVFLSRLPFSHAGTQADDLSISDLPLLPMLTQKTELTIGFLQAIRYRYFLLDEANKCLTHILAPFHGVTAIEALFQEKLPNFGDLLRICDDELVNVKERIIHAMGSIGLSEDQCPPIKAGDHVPAASPRELLVALVANDEKFVASLATTKPEVFLPDLGKKLGLPLEPVNPFAETEFTLATTVADGAVKMLFVCFHEQQEQAGRFLVGANGEFWGDLEEIGDICRRSRDLRLGAYIPAAKAAFEALKATEAQVWAENPAANTEDRDTVATMRTQAIERMRSNPAFLGRLSEKGQAFANSGGARQCCFLCQGMMGYRTFKKFKPSDIKSYLRQFKWADRGDYAHSCAEIAVSHQCAASWEAAGFGQNH